MSQTIDEAQLAFDVAKLDLILAQARSSFQDDQISLVDVALIRRAAVLFGVPAKAAHLRAKDLGLLSYQDPDALRSDAIHQDKEGRP